MLPFLLSTYCAATDPSIPPCPLLPLLLVLHLLCCHRTVDITKYSGGGPGVRPALLTVLLLVPLLCYYNVALLSAFWLEPAGLERPRPLVGYSASFIGSTIPCTTVNYSRIVRIDARRVKIARVRPSYRVGPENRTSEPADAFLGHARQSSTLVYAGCERLR